MIIDRPIMWLCQSVFATCIIPLVSNLLELLSLQQDTRSVCLTSSLLHDIKLKINDDLLFLTIIYYLRISNKCLTG